MTVTETVNTPNLLAKGTNLFLMGFDMAGAAGFAAFSANRVSKFAKSSLSKESLRKFLLPSIWAGGVSTIFASSAVIQLFRAVAPPSS